MNAIKKIVVVSLILMPCFSAIHAQQPYEMPPTSTEKIIGSISGEQKAGEAYVLYEQNWLGFWVRDGYRDKRKYYSKKEMYEICLEKAKRKYGSSYPNLYLRNFEYSSSDDNLPDEVTYSQVVGSGDAYKATDRIGRVYRYSATVVVSSY